jgi:uncharacterized membrane protein
MPLLKVSEHALVFWFALWLGFLFCFLVGFSVLLFADVQGAGGPNHYPISRPLCLLGIDACIYRDMLK